MYNIIPPVKVRPETFLLLSPELTEQTACLEERVESRAGAVFYARPTQGAETVTLDSDVNYFDWWLLRWVKLWERPDREEEEDREKEETMQGFED